MNNLEAEIRANIRKMRQEVVKNLDSKFNYIDVRKGHEMDMKLESLKKQLFKQMALKPKRDTQSDMMLRAYA